MIILAPFGSRIGKGEGKGGTDSPQAWRFGFWPLVSRLVSALSPRHPTHLTQLRHPPAMPAARRSARRRLALASKAASLVLCCARHPSPARLLACRDGRLLCSALARPWRRGRGGRLQFARNSRNRNVQVLTGWLSAKWQWPSAARAWLHTSCTHSQNPPTATATLLGPVDKEAREDKEDREQQRLIVVPVLVARPALHQKTLPPLPNASSRFVCLVTDRLCRLRVLF